MPSILIKTPNGDQATLDLSSTPVTLGRSEECDFVLRHDAEVSRFHVEIWLDEHERVVVADKGSKNGTRVDDGDVFHDEFKFARKSVRIGEHDIRVIGLETLDPDADTSVTFTLDATPRMSDTQFFPSSRGLDLNRQRLALLIQLTERICGVFERKQLLEEALDACCDALGFERGLVVLKTQRGDTEQPVTRNVQRDRTGAFKVSRTLINRALIHGERAIVNNPATDLDGNLTESLVKFPICSALCVPVLNRGEVLGAIYGDRITQASTYSPEDVDFLAAIAQQVGVGITNLKLFEDRARSQRMYAELERARLIQKQLLPAEPLEVGCVRVEGYNEPSSAVSGDYFDYFEIGAGRAGLIIADVTGHGLPAALVMANLQSAVRVALSAETSLPDLAARVNRLICRNTSSNVFVTAMLGTIDTQSGHLELVSAGHPGPILIGESGARVLDMQGSLPLGVDANEKFVVADAGPDGRVNAAMFYTDGLIEAPDLDGELLGIKPVIDALSGLADIAAANLIHTTRQVVRGHLAGQPPVDDMTLMALKLTG